LFDEEERERVMVVRNDDIIWVGVQLRFVLFEVEGFFWSFRVGLFGVLKFWVAGWNFRVAGLEFLDF
jgi:hypothetical protein